MANTSTHPITVDGVRLDTLAWNITTREGWDLGLQVEGSDEDVAGRHGQLWTPSKNYGPGKFIVSMWVRGTDSNGVPPGHGDEYKQYRDNMDALRVLFSTRHRLLDVRMNIGQGFIRQALCEVRQSIDPSFAGRNIGKFDVLFNMPYSFWRDSISSDYDEAAASVGTKNIPVLVNATAPMTEYWAIFDGPWTNPSLTDTFTGHQMTLNEAVPAGSQWAVHEEVDTTTGLLYRTSRVGVGIAFNLPTQGTQKILTTSRSGAHSPRLFALSPGQSGVSPQLTLGGTGLTAASRFRFRARKKYL